jgi:putative ABC transport system permease protein
MSGALSGAVLALRLALRELRGGVRGFYIFFACLTLGVAAIAGVGSLSAAITSALNADAGELLGGDFDIRLLQRPATPEQRAYLAASGELSLVTELRAMARAVAARGSKRTLVEIKAVDAAYPLLGAMKTDPPMSLADALAERNGVWGGVADAGLLRRLGLKTGDEITIGKARVRINGTIVHEPDRVATIVTFGPQLMVAEGAIAATDLVQPGSQIHYHYRVKLAKGGDPAAWRSALEAAFPKAGWRIRGTSQATPGLDRFLDRVTLFLTFVGLTTLLVGGIGVTNAVGSYLDGKTRTIATMKCLGAPARLVFQVYLAQILAMAALGVVLGLVLGALVPSLAAGVLSQQLPVKITGGVFAAPLAVAALFGMATALTFALWPLARAREIPAAQLFRDRVVNTRIWPAKPYIAAVAAGGALLIALTLIFSDDRWFALWFVGGAIVSLALLRGAAFVVRAAAARLTRVPNPEWRLALANLHRPGAHTASVVVSLGLGMSVLVAIVLIQGNLNRQVTERIPDLAPTFFFIDIQPGQVAAFDAAVTGVKGTDSYKRVPTLRGRIVKVNGVPVEDAHIAPDAQWAVRGDRALTYAAVPAKGTDIVAGKWWPRDYKGPPLISFDANLARGFGVGVGDTLTLNVLGREITGKIASLREIDWRTLRFDFAIIFSPGVLDGAPQTADAAVEDAINTGFDNVSVIRVSEALKEASDLLAGIGTGVRATAAVTLAAGLLVLAGAIAAGRRRRGFDAVVFKVLGATRAAVLRAFVIEYGVLGLATGIIAAAVGTLTAWAVIVWLMDADWVFIPQSTAVVVALGLAVTLIFGFAGTWRALGQKAAPLLRNE